MRSAAEYFLEKACKAHIIGRAANLKTNMPDRAVRDKRHQQIIDAGALAALLYRYFCRKLEARAKAGGGPAVFG